MARNKLVKIRVPGRVYTFMEGTGRAADLDVCPEEHDEEVISLYRKVFDTSPRKDGSRHVRLTRPEMDVLQEEAERLALVAADDARVRDPHGLADLNAATAVLRAVGKLLRPVS